MRVLTPGEPDREAILRLAKTFYDSDMIGFLSEYQRADQQEAYWFVTTRFSDPCPWAHSGDRGAVKFRSCSLLYERIRIMTTFL